MTGETPPIPDDSFWEKMEKTVKKIVHHEVHHGAHKDGKDHDHGHSHSHGEEKPKKPPIPENALNLEGVKGRWEAHTTGGKALMILGSTTAIGVVMHGALNIKRGLFGYDDTQTGEHRKGSVENLLFGAGETYVGAALFRRVMTGNKSWALWK